MSSMKKKIQGYLWDLERFGFTPNKFFKRVQNRSLRGVVCNSIPKAGTHLLERSLCLHPDLYRNLLPTIHENNIEKHGGIAKLTNSAQGGKVLITHLEFDQKMEESILQNDLASFFMVRDPRDIVVSLSHYGFTSKKHRLHSLFANLSQRERLITCIKGNQDFRLPSIGDRLSAYAGWLKSSAMIVRFEDIIGGQGAGDESAQRQVLTNIFDHCNVETPDLDQLIAKVYSNKSPTFRKGVIGGWKEVFDEEIKAIFKEVASAELVKYGYENDTNW